MKIIGITGKIGAGKTTLANMLSKENDINIIHMDYLLDELKSKKIFGKITHTVPQVDDETKNTKIINNNVLNFIYNGKIIQSIYLKLKKKLINNILNNKIKEYEKNNTDTIIIEGVDLTELDIIKRLHMLILVETPYKTRIERAAIRNKTDKYEMVKRDALLQRNIKGRINRKFDYIVPNKGNIEDLKYSSKLISARLKEDSISPEKRFRYSNNFKIKSEIILKAEEKGKNSNGREIYED